MSRGPGGAQDKCQACGYCTEVGLLGAVLGLLGKGFSTPENAL